MLCWGFYATAQNVGIGTTTPAASLHLRGNTTERLRLENAAPLGLNVPNDIVIRTGSFFTGQIRSIGTGTNSARLGFYTGAQASADEMSERLTISDNGRIGIGTVTPQHPLTFNNVDGAEILFRRVVGGSENFGIGVMAGNHQIYVPDINSDRVL